MMRKQDYENMNLRTDSCNKDRTKARKFSCSLSLCKLYHTTSVPYERRLAPHSLILGTSTRTKHGDIAIAPTIMGQYSDSDLGQCDDDYVYTPIGAAGRV